MNPASERGLRAFLSRARPDCIFRLLAVLTFCFFLGTAFRSGWTRPETDFPNYYTAAVALCHGQPLRDYYDWTWFQRQMNYAGIEHQLGAYTPQTPLTMLPFVALTRLPVQWAKRVWLVCGLFFLGATIWMLSRMTGVSLEKVWLLAFCGYFSLYTNFLYGQFYIFLLFLLTLSFYLLERERRLLAGCVAGIAFGLKLYGGPLLLYFCARRHRTAAAGMAITAALLVLLASVLFGPRDVYYYASEILPRTLEGGSIDPYHPGVPTFSTLLRRIFVAEPELNPHPLLEAPRLFFVLQALVSSAIFVFLFLGASTKQASNRHDFAWFVTATVLLSTSTASYTFILLLLPLVLLLEKARPWQRVLLFVVYFLLTFPLPLPRLFPKVWLLVALFVALGWQSWLRMPRRWILTATACVILIALVVARRNMLSYMDSPGRHFEPVAVQRGAMFSSFPVISGAGLFYQSMGNDRYVLRWLHDGRDETLSFAGQTFRPRLAPDGVSIRFELVRNRTSTLMQFDPATRQSVSLTTPVPSDSDAPVTSPNGRWSAFASVQGGPRQIWVRNLASGKLSRLTGGNCNNSSPAWEADSQSIVFASDCDRAFGLPALYRARIPQTLR